MKRPMTNDAGSIRWYWMVQPHHKDHARCKSLGDGLCAIKMVRYETWNGEAWEADPMDNHATPEQEAILGVDY